MQWFKRTTSLFLVMALFILQANAHEISIGLYDEIKRLHITANKNYEIIEDQGEDQGKFSKTRVLLERQAGARSLLRSTPAAANNLLIASAPDLVTTSRIIKINCREEDHKHKDRPCLIKIKENKYSKNPYNTYRAPLIIDPSHESFKVINTLEIEDYLRGVVAAEMPVSWHLEALKAQTVAARTYSHAMLGRRSNLGYDLKPTIEDQVYLGYNKENLRTNEAIEATNNEVLVDRQGKTIDAYFSSHDGGFTASVEDVWGLNPRHYLMPAKGSSKSSRNWMRDYTNYNLRDHFKDLWLDDIAAITILNKSVEGRASKVLISDGHSHHITLTGEEFRHHLELPSTMIKSIDLNPERLIITGSGFGHGIGMSQHGAKNLAERGKSYLEILGHYYKDAGLVKL